MEWTHEQALEKKNLIDNMNDPEITTAYVSSFFRKTDLINVFKIP